MEGRGPATTTANAQASSLRCCWCWSFFFLQSVVVVVIMASGMGVRGTMGRCYGFFADLKKCQVRQPLAVLVCDAREGLGRGGDGLISFYHDVLSSGGEISSKTSWCSTTNKRSHDTHGQSRPLSMIFSHHLTQELSSLRTHIYSSSIMK